jgi:hypothetical protein
VKSLVGLDSVTTPEITTTKPSPGCALSASGLSAPEIAELLHYEPVTVRRWIVRHTRDGITGLPDRTLPAGQSTARPAHPHPATDTESLDHGTALARRPTTRD